MSSDKFFENACERLDIAACMKEPNKRYTDPCNCYDTYYCLNYVVEREQCAEGTAFDGKICDHEDKVLFEDCDVDNPWLRCNVSDSRINELIHICGGTTSTQVQTTTSDTLSKPSPTEKPAGDNLGLIIGLAVAGVVIVVIVVILFILLWRRKKAKDKVGRDRPGTVVNQEYFENGSTDDPYAMIDDSRHTPIPIGSYMVPSSNTATRNGTLQGSTIADTLPPNLDTVYDNSASRDEPPAGYERTGDTLKPGGSEPPYFTLRREDNTESNNNTPKYDGRNQHDTGVFPSVVDDSAIQVERCEADNKQNMEDDSPYKGAKF